jgi:hypothetical protein
LDSFQFMVPNTDLAIQHERSDTAVEAPIHKE